MARKRTQSTKQRLGDCYEASGRYVLDHCLQHQHLRLVHGEVAGRGELEGIRFGHAWVLDGDEVIDVSNGREVRLPKVVYYAIGGIDHIGNFRAYTCKQALQRITKHGTWGPWDIETSTGL